MQLPLTVLLSILLNKLPCTAVASATTSGKLRFKFSRSRFKSDAILIIFTWFFLLRVRKKQIAWLQHYIEKLSKLSSKGKFFKRKQNQMWWAAPLGTLASHQRVQGNQWVYGVSKFVKIRSWGNRVTIAESFYYVKYGSSIITSKVGQII